MSDEKTVEEKILDHYRETNEVLWHSFSGETKVEDMDLDYKILAAIHSLKQANKACHHMNQYDHYVSKGEQWRKDIEKEMCDFMMIFNEFEENIKEAHGIELPEELSDIKKLRDKVEEK